MTVVRDIIRIRSVRDDVEGDDDIAYIRISSFSEPSGFIGVNSATDSPENISPRRDIVLVSEIRKSVIRLEGYEVTLKTRAEEELTRELGRIHNSWSLTELEDVAGRYQRDVY